MPAMFPALSLSASPRFERRSAPRRRGIHPVRLTRSPESDPIEAVALDLGPTGALLEGLADLSVGESVVLGIHLAGHRREIVCQGDVVRIDARGRRGVRLEHLGPAEAAALARHVAAG